MTQTHTDVLAIVAATRPAQTTERIYDVLNVQQLNARQRPSSLGTVRGVLNELRAQGAVLRLTGEEAATCGAFPRQYHRRTGFWITPAHYLSYHPEVTELPPVPQPQPLTTPAETPQTADDISTSALRALDDLRADFHARITRLATLDYPPASPEAQATRSLITLLRDLGEARWSFVNAMSEPQDTGGADTVAPVVMPMFSAKD